MIPVTYCGCHCYLCQDGTHCQAEITEVFGVCNYIDHMTGPIGLIITT